jgi:drug/metabolite transporter (DMT)-like permease
MGGCLALWWLATQGTTPRWPDPLGWAVVVWTGLVATAFARFAIFTGIQRIGSGQTALLGPVETMCIVAGAVLFLGERLALQASFGGLLVLGSALLAGRRPGARAAALRSPEPDAAAGADSRSR